MDIEIECWLHVVPQIIAKMDINDKQIQKSIQNLLIHIGKEEPQPLLFPL